MHPTPPSAAVQICRDADQLADRAVDFILQAARESVAANGRFTLALSGGSTPEKTYTRLARLDPGHGLDWSRTFLFFGDERWVPHGDPRSNYHLAHRSLLAAAPVPADHVFAIPTDLPRPADGAAAYARRLAEFFGQPADGPPPRFDLILLGLGDDGHTASLFPGAAALAEEHAWATWSPPGTLPPPVDRVTLTYPVLNAAQRVLFLVAGAAKAEPLRDVVQGAAPRERRPAAGVRPAAGTVTWLVDEAAASRLTAEARHP